MTESAIQAIQSRINRLDPNADTSGAARSLGSTAEFDAFGDKYQAALVRRDQTVASGGDTAVPSGVAVWRGFGPASGGFAGASAFSSGGLGVNVTDAIAGRGAPGARPVGGYGKMPVPSELEQYGNGRIPREAMVPLDQQSNHRLYAPAAASWNNVVEAARADGIDLRITDSYRSYDQQVDLVRRKGLYSQGGLGATPGTSNHGWGLAVDADVTDSKTRAWLVENGPRFGWIETVPREPWHWEFRPHQI
ncbi:MAG: D-alanyl-D-alanine carboxypeptidase family protein [Ilumatobacter sp.]